MGIRIAAPAKVNLSLHVTGKRDDGYHLLESLVMFADYGDALDIVPGDGCTLSIQGPFAASLAGDAVETNLVLRAAHALRAVSGTGKGAHITLYKHLPVGAGIGGGSADAAAALRGLRAFWNVDADIMAIARSLGSDVPVCIASQPTWMQGTGEILAPCVVRTDAWLVLVNPMTPLLTKDVFGRFGADYDAPMPPPAAITSLDGLLAFLRDTRNALQTPASALQPAIAEVLAGLEGTKGCLAARMSGSGATCFGVYASHDDAAGAANAIAQRHPGWWVAPASMAR